MTMDPSLLLVGRTLGALVFGVAVLGKLRHRDEFIGVVANYRLAPSSTAAAAAWLVIALELLVVLALISGVGVVAGAALAIFLLCFFAGAIGINLVRGRTAIDCGCFQSALRQRLSPALIVRNLVVAVALLPALYSGAPLPTPFQVLNGMAAGVVLFALYQVFDQLLALRESAAVLRKRWT